MEAEGNIKYCPSCNQFLSLSFFGKDKRRIDGLKVYCRECRSLKGKERYHQDLEASRKSCRNRIRCWRRNPENREKDRAAARNYYYKMGVEYMSGKMSTWRKTPSGRKHLLLQINRRRSRKESVVDNLTKDDIDFLLMIQDNQCGKCKISFDESPYTLDHIVPISHKGDTTLRNIQLLCQSCNSSKGAKTEMYRVPYECYI